MKGIIHSSAGLISFFLLLRLASVYFFLQSTLLEMLKKPYLKHCFPFDRLLETHSYLPFELFRLNGN